MKKKVFVVLLCLSIVVCMAVSAQAEDVDNPNAFTVTFVRNTTITDKVAYDVILTRTAGSDDVSLLDLHLSSLDMPVSTIAVLDGLTVENEGRSIVLTLNKLDSPVAVEESLTLATLVFNYTTSLSWDSTQSESDGISTGSADGSGYRYTAKLDVEDFEGSTKLVSFVEGTFKNEPSENVEDKTHDVSVTVKQEDPIIDGVWVLACSYDENGKMIGLNATYTTINAEGQEVSITVPVGDETDPTVLITALGGDESESDLIPLTDALTDNTTTEGEPSEDPDPAPDESPNE